MNGPGNWAGNIRYDGSRYLPSRRSVEEVMRIVAAHKKVRDWERDTRSTGSRFPRALSSHSNTSTESPESNSVRIRRP